jgi:hypothetical protein
MSLRKWKRILGTDYRGCKQYSLMKRELVYLKAGERKACGFGDMRKTQCKDCPFSIKRVLSNIKKPTFTIVTPLPKDET